MEINTETLRGLKRGQAVSQICRDGYELESKRSIAYRLQRLDRRRFTLKADGLTLTVKRIK